MASNAYVAWVGDAAKELDEIVAAHKAIGGVGRGRRHATVQINHAYAVMLSSQFQRYCRDLHTESADTISKVITNARVRDITLWRLLENRKLDTGNPNPGNLGSDFARLDVLLWPVVIAYDPRNSIRRRKLEELNEWRNAIAHQHFDLQKLGGKRQLKLQNVKIWRTACNGLVVSFDQVLKDHLTAITGSVPW